MNFKMFWKIRKILKNNIFYLKKILYRVFDLISERKEYGSLRKRILRTTVWGLIKATLLFLATSLMDSLAYKLIRVPVVDEGVFLTAVIGVISIAGVILGLYCANIASIYSSRYVNAPRDIATAFKNDRLTRKCITSIVDYIIYGFVLVFVVLIERKIGWGTVILFVVWSIVVVISYSIAGDRAHQLSDIYGIAFDSNRILYRLFTKRLNHKLFAEDINFQNHFMIVAERQINMLKAIQKYGVSLNNNDNSVTTEFMINNLGLIQSYWMVKKKIDKNSLWFKNTPKYQQWHLANDAESSIALRTGTSLRIKEEHNYWWLEEEIIAINKTGLVSLFKKRDYESIYLYMIAYEQMCSIAIQSREANFYVKHVDWIKQELENQIISSVVDEDNRNAFAGVIEVVSLLYLTIILESSKEYQKCNVEKMSKYILKAIDSGKDLDCIECLRNKQDSSYYYNIIMEVKIEGKRISPDWVIKQQIAKEEYVYLNSLLDIVREGMNHAFTLGKTLLDRKLLFEACIILTRFYEYESKINHLVNVVKSHKDELESFHIDKELKWDEFRVEKLVDTMNEWKSSVPTLLFESSSQFALNNWENKDEYPDFLGECYNHICEDSIEAIINGDINQFTVDFDNLSKLMILYQEYIRADFIKNKDLYRIEYAYYMVTSPIVEWAQIGGLAILWGEFHSDRKWEMSIKNCSESLFVKDGCSTGLAEKFIEYIQQRDSFMIGIVGRDILETGWQQGVANAIRNSGICETEMKMFSKRLKTSSKLLKAFCPNFTEMGFSIDPSEVFWILCVNPFLKEENRFHSKYSWEDKLND